MTRVPEVQGVLDARQLEATLDAIAVEQLRTG